MPTPDFEADLGDDDGPILDPPAELGEFAGEPRLASPLDELIEDLTAEVEEGTKPLRLKVKGRPGYVAVFKRDIDPRLLQRWERQSTTTRRGRDTIDPVKFNGLLLVNTNLGIEREGDPVINPDTDEPLTFRDKWFLDLYRAPSAIEATRKFYGRGSLFMAAGDGVAAASGYGDEAEEVEDSEDPT